MKSVEGWLSPTPVLHRSESPAPGPEPERLQAPSLQTGVALSSSHSLPHAPPAWRPGGVRGRGTSAWMLRCRPVDQCSGQASSRAVCVRPSRPPAGRTPGPAYSLRCLQARSSRSHSWCCHHSCPSLPSRRGDGAGQQCVGWAGTGRRVAEPGAAGACMAGPHAPRCWDRDQAVSPPTCVA